MVVNERIKLILIITSEKIKKQQKYTMPKFNLECIICWANNRGEILCPKCFKKEFPDYDSDWTPIFFQNDGEAIYECDNDDCGERVAS